MLEKVKTQIACKIIAPNFTVRVRESYGNSFGVYIDTRLIEYTTRRHELDPLFNDYVWETHDLDIENYWFLFSLLHEIGHLYTYYSFSRAERLADRDARKSVTDLEYYSLPIEDAATEWAVRWMCNHPYLAEILNTFLGHKESTI